MPNFHEGEHDGSELSVAEADEVLRSQVMSAYRRSTVLTLAGPRFKVLMALFRHNPEMGGTLRPIRGNAGHYLSRYRLGATIQVWAQDRFQHNFSPALQESLKNA